MPSHKFKVGDVVILKPGLSRNVPGGVYEIIKHLPGDGEPDIYLLAIPRANLNDRPCVPAATRRFKCAIGY